MNKLDNLFKFRDNSKFKIATKVVGIIALACSLAVLVLILVKGGGKDAKNFTRPYVFSLIPLLFVFSFMRKNDYLFLLAELTTVIADIFMILLGNLIAGVTIYFIVQLIYAAYFFFRDTNKKRRLIIIVVRAGLMLISIFVLLGIKKLDAKTALALIYAINLLTNVVYAAIFKDPILIVGFAIFAISDVFIGFGNVSFIKKILDSFNAVYFFYIISQCILVFNCHNNKYFEIK